jgi:hypothetical protein
MKDNRRGEFRGQRNQAYWNRRRENRYITMAVPKPPAMRNKVPAAADRAITDPIASAARTTLSANTSLTTPNTVKPLSVAR